MKNSEAEELFQKYRRGETTAEEAAWIESWYLAEGNKTKLVGENLDYKDIEDRIWSKLQEQRKAKRSYKLWPSIAIAAAVAAIIVSAGIYFYNNSERGVLKQVQDDVVYKQDIAPGKNTATLTSSNGSTINLSEAKTGVAIDATALTYNDGTTIDPSALGMTNGDSRSLEVMTPRGGTYSIILQDGTKVWLNADSKLKFLSNYRNKLQRIVKVEGEAYFEVAKNKAKPFIVESEGQRITVLGTHFNISAYKGEGIRTTLLEGSVKVASLSAMGRTDRKELNETNKNNKNSELNVARDREVLLKPNQQSLITESAKITVKQVNAADAISWKEGYFKFDNESLSSIMLKISRWYNVEVVYQDEKLKSTAFGGTVSRFGNVSEVLNKLQLTGKAQFKIEGQKIIVTK